MSQAGPKIIAFFDVDYTILNGNSASLFVKFMRQEGKVGIGAILTTVYYLILYKLDLLDFARLADKEVMKSKGESEPEMIETCNRWFDEMVVKAIYPEAVELIEKHRREGHELALLTAATVYLGHPLARHLKVEHVLANRLEVDADRKFTGILLRPLSYGPGKIELARGLAQKLGADLMDCFYYSDSVTDLPVLSAFGHPVAVNADPLLRKEARKRGWPLIDFKKFKVR